MTSQHQAADSHCVLIVDDDPNFRSLIRVLLETTGIQLLEARSAKDADSMLQEYRPALLMVDYRLPGMDGMQWISKIREAGWNTPVIFLSGTWCDLKTFNKLRTILSVSLILQKPIVPELFLDQIDSLLPKKRGADPYANSYDYVLAAKGLAQKPQPQPDQRAQSAENFAAAENFQNLSSNPQNLASFENFEDGQAEPPAPSPSLDIYNEHSPQALLLEGYQSMENELPSHSEELSTEISDSERAALRGLFESETKRQKAADSESEESKPEYLNLPPKGRAAMRKSATQMPAFMKPEDILKEQPAVEPVAPPKDHAEKFAEVPLSRNIAEELEIITSEEPDELQQLARFNQKASVEMALRHARADYAKILPQKVEALSAALNSFREDPSAADSYDEAIQIAHQLKGTSGSLGFPHLGKTAGLLETLLRDGVIDDTKISDKAWQEIERQLAQCLGIAHSNAVKYAEADAVPRKSFAKKVALVGPFPKFAKLTEELSRDDIAEAYAIGTISTLLKDAKQERFNCVIVDSAALDDQSPTELLEQVREHPSLRNAPVAFIADESWHNDEALWFYSGAEYLLPKTVTPLRMRGVVESMLMFNDADKPRVLTIDDDIVLTGFICDTLLAHGITAAALNEPINVLSKLEEFPADLILLDVVMPGVSGYDVCRMLRAELAYAKIPVLFLTSKNSQAGRAAAFKAGGDDFLSKPILTEELITRVRSRLETSTRYNQRAGVHDQTAMTTRQAFLENLSRGITKSCNSGEVYTVAIINIEDFQELGISLGFAVQEQLFKDLAKLLQARFRVEDLKGHWSEGSFALGFPNIEAPVVRQALTFLAGEFAVGTTHNTSGAEASSKRLIRYGVAELLGDGTTADTMLSHAYERCLHSRAVDVSAFIAMYQDDVPKPDELTTEEKDDHSDVKLDTEVISRAGIPGDTDGDTNGDKLEARSGKESHEKHDEGLTETDDDDAERWHDEGANESADEASDEPAATVAVAAGALTAEDESNDKKSQRKRKRWFEA